MKTKLIGIFICTLLIATAIPVVGQLKAISIIKENDEISPLSNGDKWIKTFNLDENDQGQSVQQTTDGGYIVVATTGPWVLPPIDKIWLIKTDSKGNMVWDKKFGGYDTYDGGYGRTVKQTSDGGYIIVGGYWDYSAYTYDIWLIKTDEEGNMEWDNIFVDTSDDYVFDLEQTNDGGYIITGFKGYLENRYAWLLKTDESGDLEWYSTYGVSGEESRAYSVVQTLDGGYVVSGSVSPFEDTDGLALWLFKTDSDGDMLWEKTFGEAKNDDEGFCLQMTDDGGYIITGVTSPPGSRYDVLLIKTDAEGELLWEKKFGGIYNNWGMEVQQTVDGGYIIIGLTGDRRWVGPDVLLIKTNSDGEKVWSKTHGDTIGADAAFSGQQTMDGGFILSGCKSYGFEMNADVLLIKTDANGDAPPVNTDIRFKVDLLRNRPLINRILLRFLEQFPILQKILLCLIK